MTDRPAPRCPAGHRSGAPDWCDVCGRAIAVVPASCPVCSAPLPGRFCDECGADGAVPAATAVVTVDPEWFAHVRERVGHRIPGLEPPPTPPIRVRLEHRRTVFGRRRSGRHAPDVDLPDDGVSARHVALSTDGDGWTVTDLASRNGTTIGSEPLTPHRTTPLQHGDVVRLGLWTSIHIHTAARILDP